MKISVIIPIYNTKHEYLRECLKSLVTQDFDGFEVIAVDDGSTNGCGSVISGFAKKYACVTHIGQENRGTSVARNTGLDRAGGEYVMFVDGDDYVSEGILASAYDDAVKKGCDLLFFGYHTVYTNRRMRRVLDNPDKALFERDRLELAVLRGDKSLGAVDVGAPWGKLIKRSVIEENNIRYTPGLIKGQDTVFTLWLLDACRSFSYLKLPGYNYRISEGSVSRRFNPGIVGIMEKTLSAYSAFVKEKKKPDVFMEAVRRKYINVLLGEYLELYFLHRDNKEGLKSRVREYGALALREPYRSVIDKTDTKALPVIKRLQIGFLKKNHVLPVFIIKKAEMLLMRLVVRRYR